MMKPLDDPDLFYVWDFWVCSRIFRESRSHHDVSGEWRVGGFISDKLRGKSNRHMDLTSNADCERIIATVQTGSIK